MNHLTKQRISITIAGFLAILCLAGCGSALVKLAQQAAANQQPASEATAQPTTSIVIEETAPTSDRNSSTDSDNSMMSSGNGMQQPATAPQRAIAVGEGEEAEAIQIAVAHPEIAAQLQTNPDWMAEAFPEEDGLWVVEFFSEAEDIELGFVLVSLNTREVVDFFIAEQLDPDALAAGQERVEALVFNDSEVIARLGDPLGWEREIEYDPFEKAWVVWFIKGREELHVLVFEEEGDYFIDQVVDPTAFTEVEQQINARNTAIELAFEADGVDQALQNTDDWYAYVEPQSNNQWSVAFVSNGQELFFAVVDLETDEVVQVRN
ncbi:MAG: hypothetical protein AAF485_29315 [Chloroflexota bacterium]